MYYNNNIPYMNCSGYGMDFTQEAFDKALELIREAVQDERNDELKYEYLISVAPTQDERSIITSIRDDERNHRRLFKDIYRFYTGREISSRDVENYAPPSSFIDGVSKAIMGELNAMEKYRLIREGLPSRLNRDTVFMILTDEIKHAIKYNYILNKYSLKS